MMMVAALIAIITPAITYLFVKVSQGFAADEMRTALKTSNERALLRIHDHLLASKHMYQNDANHSGVSFIAAVSISGTAPAVLAGSRPGDSQPSGVTSLSPNSGSMAASFGNEIMFAAYDSPQTFFTSATALTYLAPATISGAAVTYSVYPGVPATVIIDVYRIYYYYLTSNGARSIPGVNVYNLTEWESIQYADWYEINNVYNSDSVLGQAIVNFLTSPPASYHAQAITMALDTSQVIPTSAFYQLTNGSYPVGAWGSPVIQQATWTNLTQISSGILCSGFSYGICGNTAAWTSAPIKVPLYTTASGNFPGAFEVGMLGNGAGLQVMTRLGWVARGASPKIIYNDNTIVTNAKDVW
jgi:hypothetical protein